ncbi:MAG: response regulator [Candidatus Omnitrophica bacterium]|nr:response regulator [Candidatus Omnitrophota bacterium]
MSEKIKVLLIDDDADFINMMQLWLSGKGFSVDVLYNGEEVVDKVKNNGYQIMFLDLNLPGQNGLEILSEIRIFSKIPVIIFSAFGTKDRIKQATELGISGFFAKEKGFDEAARMIYTALRIHKGLSRLSEEEGRS